MNIDRRGFMGAVAAGGLATTAALAGCSLRDGRTGPARAMGRKDPADSVRVAGMTLKELRRKYEAELFDEYIPFWQEHGIDHELGGVMAFLAHDGTAVSENKFHWFQGRGIYFYCYVYNHLRKDPALLEASKKTLDFLLTYFPQDDGWWAEEVTRDGRVVRPFSGDPFGIYFGIEGMQELAWATDDRALAEEAKDLFKAHVRRVHDPAFTVSYGIGDPGERGVHGVNTYMLDLQICTAMLQRWPDAELEGICDAALDAIMNHYYNPDLGILNEYALPDFTKREEDVTKSNLGHGVEIMWMVMDEAIRRGDTALYEEAKERMRFHFELGWDHVFGGISEWMNVDHGCYDWGEISPRGSGLEGFHGIGEYLHIKPLWAVNEAVVGLLLAMRHSGEPWAADYLGRCQRVLDEKFSLRPHGYPLHLMFCDRRISYIEEVSRKPNYHPTRMLARGILLLDEMLGAESRRS